MLEESLVSQSLFLLAALIASVLLTVRTRSILMGGLCLYGLFVLQIVLFSIIIPALLVILQFNDYEVNAAFPEETGIVPVVLLYWIPAFLFAALVRLIHAAFTKALDTPRLWASYQWIVRLTRRLRLLPGDVSTNPGKHMTYPKWTGVILGFLLAGSAHFLSGRRRTGVAWYLSLVATECLAVCLIAIPGSITYLAAVAIMLVAFILWLVMLKQSYRPAMRIGVLGWLLVLATGMSLRATERWATRLVVHPFRMTTGSMRPTLEGIHAREIPGGQTRHGSIVGRFAWGERYVRWLAENSGAFNGPHYPRNGSSPWREYWVGSDVRYLPSDIKARFSQGQRVTRGDLVWSGMVVAGDRFVVEKLSYLFRGPRRGEIVALRTGGLPKWYEDSYIAFRVAGLPGERVRIEPPWLVVNGERVTDPPIFSTIAAKERGYAGFSWPRLDETDANSPSEEVALGDDEYFLLGDNTPNAYDSRYCGTIPRKNIVGRVTRIYWPLDRINALEGRR